MGRRTLTRERRRQLKIFSTMMTGLDTGALPNPSSGMSADSGDAVTLIVEVFVNKRSSVRPSFGGRIFEMMVPRYPDRPRNRTGLDTFTN
ncbi:hypothetical protein GWI33_016449 [Rhynchophorus ferrugineus]|uniref:Uncharacterized protein n=1 Tax=Rhynchophorus ferrugineus TaxID=354439 RepID=A0A834M8N9_RHYFE|nr:hypothetical protein GWI33_016449 [Rhynchophorus ferrugineus]